MTLGPITITPDAKTAATLHVVARQLNAPPEAVVLRIITENIGRYLETAEDDTFDLASIEGVLMDDTGIEKLPWSEIIGAFSSAEPHDDDECLEELLEEEWLRDVDY